MLRSGDVNDHIFQNSPTCFRCNGVNDEYDQLCERLALSAAAGADRRLRLISIVRVAHWRNIPIGRQPPDSQSLTIRDPARDDTARYSSDHSPRDQERCRSG
jgi:hypothetical protein